MTFYESLFSFKNMKKLNDNILNLILKYVDRLIKKLIDLTINLLYIK